MPDTIRDLKKCAYAEEDEKATIKWLLSDKISEMTLQERKTLAKTIDPK